MSESVDLAAFLLARLKDSEEMTVPLLDAAEWFDGRLVNGRALKAAEYRALRAVVALHSEGTFERGGDHLCYDSMTSADECATLQALAVPYASHLDYRHNDWDPNHFNGVCTSCDER